MTLRATTETQTDSSAEIERITDQVDTWLTFLVRGGDMSVHTRFFGDVLVKLVEGEPVTLTAEESKLFGEALLQRTSGRRLATVALLAKSNGLMLEAVQRFKPNDRISEQGRWLHKGISSYQTNGWFRERDLKQCPSRHAGKPEQWFWQILKMRGGTLPREGHLINTLRDAARAFKRPSG